MDKKGLIALTSVRNVFCSFFLKIILYRARQEKISQNFNVNKKMLFRRWNIFYNSIYLKISEISKTVKISSDDIFQESCSSKLSLLF